MAFVRYSGKTEIADRRKIRERNKVIYRFAHWPIWIWVFFIAPGPLTFDLFAHGPSRSTSTWLLIVLSGTGVAGLFGKLPGVEPRPYILRFTEDRPNPIYRRICYTFAWSAVLTFALLNLTGLLIAVVTGRWNLREIYDSGYFPLSAVILCLGAAGMLPRVKPSTKGEGTERRYFYGSVWAVCFAQVTLFAMWKLLPRNSATDVLKLAVYIAVLGFFALLATQGRLPRTRPIVPGELAVAD